MSSECVTSSLIPIQVSIAFGCCNGAILLYVVVYSFKKLMAENEKFIQANKMKKIWILLKDVWKRKSCFIQFLTHLVDQISDIAVAIEFAVLATETKPDDCGGINMWYLFALTVLSILSYRVISSYLIYVTTSSLMRVCSQLLDLELFRTLYINYVLNKSEPCDPQRWISGMEATFESSPQALIQIIFLVKTDSWNASPIVVISFVWSVFSVISKVVSNDKRIVINGISFTQDPLMYLLRYIWRFCDVSSRIFLWCLIWLSIGGTSLSVICFVEIVLFLVISFQQKNWSLMFSLVSIPNFFPIFLYRFISNFVILALITCFISFKFSCPRCPSFDERISAILNDQIIFIIYVYAWIASFTIGLKFIIPFKQDASSSRTLAHMAKSQDWDGIKEMHLYSGIGGSWIQRAIHALYPERSNYERIVITLQIVKYDPTRDAVRDFSASKIESSCSCSYMCSRIQMFYRSGDDLSSKENFLYSLRFEAKLAEILGLTKQDMGLLYIPPDDDDVYSIIKVVNYVRNEETNKKLNISQLYLKNIPEIEDMIANIANFTPHSFMVKFDNSIDDLKTNENVTMGCGNFVKLIGCCKVDDTKEKARELDAITI